MYLTPSQEASSRKGKGPLAWFRLTTDKLLLLLMYVCVRVGYFASLHAIGVSIGIRDAQVCMLGEIG